MSFLVEIYVNYYRMYSSWLNKNSSYALYIVAFVFICLTAMSMIGKFWGGEYFVMIKYILALLTIPALPFLYITVKSIKLF